MAVISLSNLTFFENGSAPASSEVVGYENSKNRVARYKFKAPAEGANHLKFTIANISKQNGFDKVDVYKSLRFYIGTSSTDHANAGTNSSYTGSVKLTKVSGDYYSATGDVDILLLPNTTYYLWIFPSTAVWGWFFWYPDTETVTVTGAAGVVEIDTGSGFVKAIPYIDDGTSWKMAAAYVDNGSTFKICT